MNYRSFIIKKEFTDEIEVINSDGETYYISIPNWSPR
jgi:hypothetical protein